MPESAWGAEMAGIPGMDALLDAVGAEASLCVEIQQADSLTTILTALSGSLGLRPEEAKTALCDLLTLRSDADADAVWELKFILTSSLDGSGEAPCYRYADDQGNRYSSWDRYAGLAAWHGATSEGDPDRDAAEVAFAQLVAWTDAAGMDRATAMASVRKIINDKLK
ncbi:hypothetical protein [Streptomyces sp. NPDC059918]|uniref:hypothetical protein n=1 Tax=unclassified Streptomyces TaxID=2593676 RepID=UPI00366275D7